MKRQSLPWLVLAGGLVFALLVASVVLNFTCTQQLRENNFWLIRTRNALDVLEDVLSLAKDAETGQRGFVITGEASYLDPYDEAIGTIHGRLDRLEGLIADDSYQQARLPALKQHIDAKLHELDAVIVARKKIGFDAARQAVSSGRGKSEMDAIRGVVGEMTSHEESVLHDRSIKSERAYRTAVLTGLSTGAAAFAAVIAFVVLLMRHLTDHEKAAATVAAQAERLRTTLRSIGDGVITTDVDGRITNMNVVAESLTGWNNEEISGEALDSVFHIVNETTRQPVVNPAARALAEGVIVGLANHTVLIAKDGTERPIDDSAAPIRGNDGEVIGCVLVFRDVTERRLIERRLRRSEERLRFVMDSMPQMIFTAEPNGDIDYFNPQWSEFTGLAFEQMKDWGWTRFVHPDDAAENVRVWRHSIETGEPFHFEHRFRRADGEFRWHLTRAVPLTDGDDKVVMWVGSNTDIHAQRETADDLRRLASKLSESDRRKNEFLAMLAHELRNPLAPIRNSLKLMRMTHGDDAAVDAASEMMERQVGQMVRLVDDLLDVSRLSRGKIELRRERIDLQSVMNHAIEAVHPQFDSMGHELTVSMRPQPIFLNADPTRIAQVAGNLLSNACKFTKRGGRIRLSVDREDDEAVIRIHDSGIGIAAEQLPHVFDMFMQIDTSLERSASGLGIGLTLVKSLVEMHGGRVEIRSAGLGQGSEFTVRLPVLMESPDPPPRPAADEPARPAARRILVVDDNRDSAESLAMLLKLTGNETRTAFDGLVAVEAAGSFRPDAVLLDIGLPKLNGYEAARKIRATPWGRSMVLVALTGWGQEEDRRKSKEAGFDGHLVKPVEYGALMELLGELHHASA